MKERFKNILSNSLIVFIIWFIFLTLFDLRETYYLYKSKAIESFELVLWFSFRYSFVILILFIIPIMSVLELFKIKKITKVIITLVITFIIVVVYVLSHLTIQF